jgi:hypothetical protein
MNGHRQIIHQICVIKGWTDHFPSSRINYNVDSMGVSLWYRTQLSQMLLVLKHTILGCLQVHGPATLPAMFVAREEVEYVPCIAVFQA